MREHKQWHLAGATDAAPRAHICQRTLATARRERRAAALPVDHEQVIDAAPVPARKFFAQGHFGLFRCARGDVAPAVGDAVDVGVNADTRQAERFRNDKVGGFSPHARQGE